MLIINKDSVTAIKQKLTEPEQKQQSIDDIGRMLEIKKALLWRADAGVCCGIIRDLARMLAHEVNLLEDALEAANQNDTTSAASILEDYIAFLEQNYESEQPNYCRT